MTYVIAEPCIDVKDRSCVDVCPVDCIHELEGARMLVIDPEECIDCFSPSELVLTNAGVKTLRELENQSFLALTDRGFKPAIVKRFRRKPLTEVELQPAFEERGRYGGTRLTTRNVSRFRRRVSVTATHPWLLANGEATDSLEVGQFLPSMRFQPERDSEGYRRGILHGLIFGDGSWNKQEVESGLHYHYVQLYGQRVAQFKDYFDHVNFSKCLAGVRGYVGTGVVRAETNLKLSLPVTSNPAYIAGFLEGWIAADGDPTRAGSWRLRSINHEALAWAELVAPLAGYIAVGSGQESNLETNKGLRSRPIRWLYLATRETYWRVMSVKEVAQEAEDTFCAIVPGKHEFTLAGGIYTHNCGACTPECPVEAIFPSEDEVPEEWQDFVPINYAYEDGAERVNTLVDEYLASHELPDIPGYRPKDEVSQMVSEQAVRKALAQVVDPELRRPLTELGMLSEVRVEGGVARVGIVLTVPGCPLKDSFRDQVHDVLAPLGLERVELRFRAMDASEREALRARLAATVSPREAELSLDERTRVLAVVSGKGGVGKSTLTANLAAALADSGQEVGLLDADVYGHAIPQMMGIAQQPVVIDHLIVPPTRRAVKLMSIGFFLTENKPLMWRGPMLHKALERFVTQVHWGPLDTLLIDMPPGTGDVAISLAQLIPRTEAVVVTTPQRVAEEVAARAALAARRLHLVLVGVIENMSYLAGDGRELLGAGGGERLAARMEIPLLGRVPLDPALATATDLGEPLVWAQPESEAAEAISALAATLSQRASVVA